MRTRLPIAVVATAAAGVLASSALAAPTGTTVTSVARTGTTVAAAGTAAFDGKAPATAVGGTNTPFADPAAAAAAGVDLKEGLIEVLPDGSGLRFTWKLASLPAQVPPEVARYTWAFGVGGKEYQLQAKRTNMGATTVADDVPGHVQQLSKNGFFQVRGNCGPLGGQVATVTSCPHLAFLEGAFDSAKGTVHVDLPFGTAAVPELVPGAVVQEAQVATMSIAAGFSAVISNTQTSDFTNGWQPYYVGKQVLVGTGLASSKTASNAVKAVLADDGTWTATVTGVPATHTKLIVRSCEGATSTCTVTESPLG